MKRHQDNAKCLWNRHKVSISKQEVPGPGAYLQEPNQYLNSFMGEGAHASFGTGPRLPASQSLYDRTMALQRMQNRKSSYETSRDRDNYRSNQNRRHMTPNNLRPILKTEENLFDKKSGYTFGVGHRLDVKAWDYN